jgi:uncharacterized membrane protein (DUF2068 family)
MPAFPTAGYYGFKVIGALKLLSGLLAVLAGFGAHRFFDHDPKPRLERAVTHLGLDPNNQFIHTVISRATGIDRTHLRAVEAGTFFYAILHLVEGIGLMLEQDWAGYLVVVATSSLVPFELYEIARKPTPLRTGLLALNIIIVVYLITCLRNEHKNRAKRAV